MAKLWVTALVVLLASGVFALAQTRSYSITVAVDETTDTDLAVIETFAASAKDGDLISQSLRRVVMAAVGEVWLRLQDRIDAAGNLTLDDGTVQPLATGDEITTAVKERVPVVLFVCRPGGRAQAAPCQGMPEAVLVCHPGQKCAVVAMPGREIKK